MTLPRLTPRRRRVVLVLVLAAAAAVVTAAAVMLRSGANPYRPGDDVEGLTDVDRRALPAGAPRPVYTNVAAASGVAFRHFSGARSSQLPEDTGSGAAWGDYDDDGRVDLYLVNETGPLTMTAAEREASPAYGRLYHNEGGGRFRDVTEAAGLVFRGLGQGAAWGDVDGDGRLDLVVTSYGGLRLYRNKGGGGSDAGFEDATVKAGMDTFHGYHAGPTFFDYDKDGKLDLYVCGYVRYREDPELRKQQSLQYKAEVPASLNPSTFEPELNLLFHNLGQGRFEEVAAKAGVTNPGGRSLSAAAADFDDDGWPDLYVANDVSDNALFRNRGDGSFEEIGARALVADYRAAMGLAVGDFDNDGDLDFFITHWLAQENAFYVNVRAETGSLPGQALRFSDAGYLHGLAQNTASFVGWGASFLDFDRDGRLDLMAVNGSTRPLSTDTTKLEPMRSMLYWNAGAADGYHDLAEAVGGVLARPLNARGLAIADYDGDGDPDAAVNVNGGEALLLRNDTEARGHWLTLRLRGSRSNTFAVGARVTLAAGGVKQMREYGCQSSYLSQNTAGEETWGLGAAAVIDLVTVRWPSGAIESAGPLAVDRVLTWREGEPPAALVAQASTP